MSESDYKTELEEQNKKLVVIYKEILLNLNKSYKSIKSLAGDLKQEEINFEAVSTMADCIKFKLDESTKLLNKIYNGEEYTHMNTFKFDPCMIVLPPEIEKTERKKQCICGSTDLFLDDCSILHCKNCEQI